MPAHTAKPKSSLLSWIQGLLKRSPRDEQIGEVLVKNGLITPTQLEEAIEAQKKKFFQTGLAVPLGKIIVEKHHIPEQEIIDAVNAHYNVSLSSLSDNMRALLGKIRGSLTEDIPAPRVPIWLQLSITTMFILAFSIALLSYVILKRQQENLFDHTVKLGTVSLNYVADNAKVPLLTGDTLALTTLVNNVASVDGHFYAYVMDNSGIIKAHTDHEKIDQPASSFSRKRETQQQGELSYFNYTMPDGRDVLNLSRTIVFQEKKIGEVHIGMSLGFVQKLFVDERTFLVYAIAMITILGMVVAVLFSLRFSRPVSALVHATSEIARGNYAYKVRLKRRDEFGTLAAAFNRMGTELFRQSMMRETFGKYVGPEVLNMILHSPGETWLKGRKNEASILFADIRGFTGYAASNEPEVVVQKLNEFFEIATEVIVENDGYIDKFVGDSVLAVFGVPVYLENHLQRCMKTALDMQRRFAEADREDNPLIHSVGIGIASGVVVAGNIGSQAKMEYTVIGDCVNVACYMNSLAASGEIIAGGSEMLDLADIVDMQHLEPRKIKGREGLVDVARVHGIKTSGQSGQC